MQVYLNDGDMERGIRTLKRGMQTDGIFEEIKERLSCPKHSDRVRLKARKARIRRLKRDIRNGNGGRMR
jgi:ribosomal protein S21